MALDACKWSILLFQTMDTNSNLKVTKELLKHLRETDIAKTSNDETSLHREKDLKVKKLLQRWVNLVDHNDNTLLHLAVGSYKNLEIAKTLLEHGASASKVNCYESTPLHLAVTREKNIEIVRELLRGGACVQVKNGQGHTPLQLAVEFNRDPEVTRELIEQGADVSKTDRFGKTLLHRAVTRRKCFEIMKVLLKHGADPGKRDKCGRTALHQAIMEEKDPETIKELAEHGNCINVADNNGDTPLHFATTYRRTLETLKVLLECGADVSKVNCAGKTVLHKSVTNVHRFIKFNRISEWFAADETLDTSDTTLDHDSVIMSLKLLIKYALIQGFEGNYYKLLSSGQDDEMEDVKMFLQEHALERFFENCAFEVAQMKLTMVNARVSLYTFMTRKTNGALYPNGETVRNITDEALISNYPVYNDIISPKVKYALEKATLLYKYIWMHVSVSNRVLEKRNVLMNYDCVSLIAEYLSDEDMSNFIMAYQDSSQGMERFPASSNYPATASKRLYFGTGFEKDSATTCIKKAKLK